jgi:outer membrane protein assembly factor BamB
MSEANSLRALRCPNCGAPIEFAPGQSSVRCRFCDSVIENSSEAMTDADHAHVISGSPDSSGGANPASGQARRFVIKMRDGAPVVIESSGAMGGMPSAMDAQVQSWQSSIGSGGVTSVPMATPQPKRSSWLGCLVWVVIIVAIVAAIPAIIFASSPQAAAFVQQLLSGNVQQALGTASTIGTRIVIANSGTIVPGANDGPPEAIMLTTEYPASASNGEKRVVAVSTTTHKLLWQSGPLDTKLYDTPILATADFVFIVNQQQLMALRRTDGTVGWQDTLADKLSISLCDCVKLVGTKLAVFSDDGTLEVFDTATGKSLWKVSSKSASPRGLYVLGKRLAFMDRDSDTHGVLRAFDLATGKETSAQPQCPSADQSYTSYGDWTTPLILSPAGTEFYLAFGSSPACAQRWDAQSLQMTWSTQLPADFAGSVSDLRPVFSADTLYLANRSNVLAFGLDQGDAHTTLSNADYSFDVLTTHGADVILTARSQRGTTRYAIWAVNGASGDTHWTFDMGENPPMTPGGIVDDSQPMWLAQPATDGLRVVRFQSASDNKSYKLLVDMVNWDTGESAGQKTNPLNLDTIILTAPEWTIWKNDTMWMVINDQLMAFDFGQNKFVYQWP